MKFGKDCLRTFWDINFLIFQKNLFSTCSTPRLQSVRGSSNTSLEPSCRDEENAFYRMSLALSKPEISGFQFCISVYIFICVVDDRRCLLLLLWQRCWTSDGRTVGRPCSGAVCQPEIIDTTNVQCGVKFGKDCLRTFWDINFLNFGKNSTFNMQAASAVGHRGSSNTSLEPARRAENNAFYRTSLALSKPEISGFQFCIRYTLNAVDW